MNIEQIEQLRIAAREIGAALAAEGPMMLVETAQALETQLDDYAHALTERAAEARAEAAAQEAAALLAAGAQPPAALRVPIALEPSPGGGSRIVGRTPEAAPAARTMQKVLDLIAQTPLGSMAQAAMEVALHVEALELENANLRARLAALGET